MCVCVKIQQENKNYLSGGDSTTVTNTLRQWGPGAFQLHTWRITTQRNALGRPSHTTRKIIASYYSEN